MIRSIAFILLAFSAVSAEAQRPTFPTTLARADIQRFAMVLSMADNRRFDTTAADVALASSNLAVRREAALAMGQVGRSPKGWPTNSLPQRARLQKLLRDNYDYIVEAAAYSIGLLRDTASVDSLPRVVRIGGAAGREAAWAMGQIGNPSARHIAELLKLQNDEGTTIQLLLAASKLRPFPLSDIRPYLQSTNPSVVWAAAYAISRNRVAAGVPDLLALYDSASHRAAIRKGLMQKRASRIDRGPYVSDYEANDRINGEIARGLSMKVAGKDYEERSFVALRSIVHEHHPHVRIMALRSLATYGERARDLVIESLHDTDANVRATAAEALVNVIDTTFKDWSKVYQADTSMGYRFNILMAVAKHRGPKMMINNWVSDPGWEKRMLAAQAVGSMVDRLNGDIYMRTLLSDTDPRVRGRMYSSLVPEGTEPDSAARKLLLTALESDPDSIVKQLVRVPLKIPNPDSLHAIRIIPRPLEWYERIVKEVVAPTLNRRPRVATLRTERGDITLELFGVDAPITVWNFIDLAKSGWTQGTAFHRVVPNFVVQDGNRRGDGEGGPGYSIRDELNPNRYDRGVLGMALSGPDTGGSEYFITHSPQPHLDGGYTVFGKVTSGFNVLDNIVRGDNIKRIVIR